MVLMFVLISAAISFGFVFMFNRKCISAAFYSLLIFSISIFFLYYFYMDFKKITNHEKLVNISIALCGKRVKKPRVYCGPEFTVSGIEVRILSSFKKNKLSEDEINKIVIRAEEIKPLLAVKVLKLNFAIQVIDKESINKSKGTKATFYSYHIYKTIQI